MECLKSRKLVFHKTHSEHYRIRHLLVSKVSTSKLRPLSSNTPSYIKDLASFIDWIKKLEFSGSDLMFSFDVVSLYTMIPVDEAL